MEARTLAIDPLDGTEVTRRGEDLYEARIRSQVEGEEANIGRLVVIDVASGDYEIDDRGVAATHRLRERRPGGVFYAKRIGYDAAYTLHGRLARTKK